MTAITHLVKMTAGISGWFAQIWAGQAQISPNQPIRGFWSSLNPRFFSDFSNFNKQTSYLTDNGGPVAEENLGPNLGPI